MMSVVFILNSRIYKIMARMISQINLRQIRFFLPFLAGCHNVEFRVNVANTLLSTNSVFYLDVAALSSGKSGNNKMDPDSGYLSKGD